MAAEAIQPASRPIRGPDMVHEVFARGQKRPDSPHSFSDMTQSTTLVITTPSLTREVANLITAGIGPLSRGCGKIVILTNAPEKDAEEYRRIDAQIEGLVMLGRPGPSTIKRYGLGDAQSGSVRETISFFRNRSRAFQLPSLHVAEPALVALLEESAAKMHHARGAWSREGTSI